MLREPVALESNAIGLHLQCKHFVNNLPGHPVIFEDAMDKLICEVIRRKPSPARNKSPRMGRDQAVGDLMAVETRTNSWRERRCRRHRPGIAVSVSESAWSWSPGPPSRGRTCPQWCRALSMIPAKGHSARAGGFGRTARAMTALRRRRAIWISCFHLR